MIANPADSLSDLFMFDEFKSRDSPFYVNLGFLRAVFLQPLLKAFEKPYSITYDVVLAYLPKKTDPFLKPTTRFCRKGSKQYRRVLPSNAGTNG